MGQLAAGVAAVVGDGADLAGGAAVGDVADSVGLGLAGEWHRARQGVEGAGDASPLSPLDPRLGRRRPSGTVWTRRR